MRPAVACPRSQAFSEIRSNSLMSRSTSIRLGNVAASRCVAASPFLAILLCAAISRPVSADNWNLRGAGVLSGTPVPYKDESSVIVRTQDGVMIQLAQSQISREIKTSQRGSGLCSIDDGQARHRRKQPRNCERVLFSRSTHSGFGPLRKGRRTRSKRWPILGGLGVCVR